jgi:hypothetical protein
MGVLLAGVIVLTLVAVVVAGNRHAHQDRRPLGLRGLGTATAWAITLLVGTAGALLVVRGVIDVVDPNTDTAPVAAGAILIAFGVLGAVMAIRARRG